MAFNEDPEKGPFPDPSTGTESSASQHEDEKEAIAAAESDDAGALDKEIAVEPIHAGRERDLEKQDVSPLKLPAEECL
jgi:hypothetical protein